VPLTEKGEEILGAMKKEYGAKEGESNFYASRNAGTIKGVDNAQAMRDAELNMSFPTPAKPIVPEPEGK